MQHDMEAWFQKKKPLPCGWQRSVWQPTPQDAVTNTAAAPVLPEWVGPACSAHCQWLLQTALLCLLSPSAWLVCSLGTIRCRRLLRCWMGPPSSRRALQMPSPMATPPSTVRGMAPSGDQAVRWGPDALHSPPGVLRLLPQELLWAEVPARQMNSLPLPESPEHCHST